MDNMEFHKVIDDGKLIRIEEPSGSRITARVEGRVSRLLSIYVPKEQRLRGIGGALLSIAEKEMLLRGIKVMDVAFAGNMWELVSFLEREGYDFSPGGNVISYTLEDIRKIVNSKNMLLKSVPGSSFTGILDLREDEYKGMYGILDRMGTHLTWDDMCTYSRDYSGVVFDREKKPKVVILSRFFGKELYIDLVACAPGTEDKYVDIACQNLLNTIIDGVGIDGVHQVSGILSNEYKGRIVTMLSEKGITQTKRCDSIYGKKLLKDDLKALYDYIDDTKEEGAYQKLDNPELLWHLENEYIDYQPGIGFKVSWMKRRKM